MKRFILIALVLSFSITYAQRPPIGVSNIGAPQFSQSTYFAQDPGLSYKLGDKGVLLSYTSEGQETQGSRLLIKGWAKGRVLFKNNSVHESYYVLNYDKIKDVLIARADEKHVLEIEMSTIQSFSLIDSSANEYTFLRVTGNPSNFLIAVHIDSSYSLYKKINTRFYRADYENKGLYEKGYKYDRYEDELIYYIKDGNGNLTAISNLNKKGFKGLFEVFPKSKEFISKNKATSDKENFLTKLTIYLNEH